MCLCVHPLSCFCNHREAASFNHSHTKHNFNTVSLLHGLGKRAPAGQVCRRWESRYFTMCPSSQQHQATRNTGSWHNNCFLISLSFVFVLFFLFPPFFFFFFCWEWSEFLWNWHLCRETFWQFLMHLSLFLSLLCISGANRICRHRRRCCWKHIGRKKTKWKEHGATKEEFFNYQILYFFFLFLFYLFLSLDCCIADHAQHPPPSRRI